MEDLAPPAPVRCPTCGAECAASAAFCRSCGMPLASAPPAPGVSGPVPAPPALTNERATSIASLTAEPLNVATMPAPTLDRLPTSISSPSAAQVEAPLDPADPPTSAAISSTSARCQWCGTENPADAGRCQSCGAAFPKPEQDAAVLSASRERVRQAEDYIATVRTVRGWSILDIFRRNGKRSKS
ncbi:MAG TPA: hypothetical protein VIC85_22785 [Ktedonobacterales bacterium]